ncbi:MAG: 50S ribosomal protein L10 [Patescibacteria group bacterium]|nr:50S ribosomal protein L10 [Patescibacteria group bacterium]
MPLSKNDKKILLDDLSKKITSSKTTVFAGYHKMKVKDMQDLRKKLKEQHIDIKVVKNTLLKKVLEDQKIDISEGVLDKPLACVFGTEDEVGAAKIIYDFGKNNENLVILGGILEEKFIDTNAVNILAKLPSREMLYAQVVSRIKAPISGFVSVLKGNLVGLVSVLKQYQESIK